VKAARNGVVFLLLGFGCLRAAAPETTAVDAAVGAVHGWYATLGEGSDQEHLTEFGTVGAGQGPLVQAYEHLAASLRKQMDREQFLAHFRGLARMRLLQAHPASATAREDYVQVFVEEERTMAIEGIPAMAWFQGFLTVTRSTEGWRISSLEDVKPEDIIDALDEHLSRRSDPAEVAMARLGCGEGCNIAKKTLPQNGTERLGRVTIQTPRGIEAVSVARLHDGEWAAIDAETETGAPAK